MLVLTLGVLLFAAVHFIPSLAPGVKQSWQGRFGENGYKGIFSLLLLVSFALIIFGWRSSSPTYMYALPPAFRTLTLALTAVAFWLFIVSNRPSRVRQFLRHPQLTGVAIWAIAHLLVNGDSRSLILFGGLLVWSVGEILAINRREGQWEKQAIAPWSADIVNIVVAAIVFVVLIFLHPWLSGVPVI